MLWAGDRHASKKLNKNKGLHVPTKMGTSQTPANVAVSCAWRGNCRRKGFEVTCPAEFWQGHSGGPTYLVFCVRICLGRREYMGVLDTGATISIVAKKILPRGELKNFMPTAAIRTGDGHVVHSCGDCDVDVPMRSRSLAHRFYVMDTEAFNFVLGTNFFVEHSQILSLTLQAPYVHQMDHGDGGESVPLEQSEHTSSYLRVCKKEPSTMMVASKPED